MLPRTFGCRPAGHLTVRSGRDRQGSSRGALASPSRRLARRMRSSARRSSASSVKCRAAPCSCRARAAAAAWSPRSRASPVGDLLVRFPPVPGSIPGQHDANGFLEQSEVACLARPDRDPVQPGDNPSSVGGPARKYGSVGELRVFRVSGGIRVFIDQAACSATRWLGMSASRWVGMTGDGKGPVGGVGGALWCPGCRGGGRVVVVSCLRGRSACRPGRGGHWSFTSVMAARTAVVSAMVL